MGFKNSIKKIIPPILVDLVSSQVKKSANSDNLWVGDYASWSEAMAKSIGYDDEFILTKVLEAILKV